ncbi:ribonuclease Y [Spiroplasma floricola]|uniref:Ribonuclease Y n=1 Tax=Spiroplasma floricola 23-6 TaxID=1336749 RepID=A0A2K8SD42_9MOLU|nr:ribonuclease Y [Spiroplasma floricola]AUB31387.1 ribonucrease Y [Spiroplasma floricola 23-6]
MLVTNLKENIFIAFLTILIVFLSIAIGFIVYLVKSRRRKYILQKIKDEAKIIKMNIIAEAKAKADFIKLTAENETKYIQEKILLEEKNLKLKQVKIDEELSSLSKKEEFIIEDRINLNKKRKELEVESKKILLLLENISNLTEEEVKNEIFTLIENKYLSDFTNKIKKQEENLARNAQKKAIKILIEAMQSVHIEVTSEKNTTFFELENESLKGKIIGKEGRNIKTFQSYGGVDIIIDDTPNRITISSFNPIRREIAYLTLQELLKSARIHPAAIEEQLILQEEKLEKHCYDIGINILEDLKIDDFPSEIVIMLGKLKFRHSYGQNVLQHSIEVAIIAKNIAKQLNLDEKIALKSGLLHDIGKAVDFEKEGSHVTLGVNILRKYDMDNIIINAVESHHNDVEKNTYYAEIIAIADAISAARPGARNNDSEDYFIRIKNLEDICLKQKGVLKAYVLKSGREIRVMVNPNAVDDYNMKKLSFKIKEEIQKINKTPGDIYITIIREKRETIKL